MMREPITYTATGCVEIKPTSQTVHFANAPINVSALSRVAQLDQSYLSRILAGKSEPSLAVLRTLSAALGLTMEQFLESVQVRKGELGQKRAELEQLAADRAEQETALAEQAVRDGKIPIPQMPGIRKSA